MARKGQKKTVGKFDPDFRFLLALDPALEGWRAWAAAYWAGLPRTNSDMQTALNAYLVNYLHGQGLHILTAEAFFAREGALPAPDTALGLALMNEHAALAKHDTVSDFLEWILREKLAQPDADGHRVVPPHLANPFPRRAVKVHGKTADLSFAHVLRLDPRLEDWRSLAAEWL